MVKFVYEVDVMEALSWELEGESLRSSLKVTGEVDASLSGVSVPSDADVSVEVEGERFVVTFAWEEAEEDEESAAD